VLLKASWQAAWRRAPGDVWLIAGTGEKVVAVQHQRRPGATPIPNEAERLALAEPMTREPGECPRPFSDVRALLPHQMGYDESVTLSPEKARSMLSAVLAKHARFRHLEFVLHGCYGEDCVGAVFSDRAETEALSCAHGRAALGGERRKVALLGNLRCQPPPASERFKVAR
jgi:hypothetical protein